MLKKFSNAFDGAMKKMNRVVGVITVTVLVIIFSLMSIEILSRSLFQMSYAWSMELSRFGLIIVIFFGGSILFYENGHVSVTLFHNLLHPKTLEIMKTVFDIVTLYFAAMYLWYSFDFALAGMYTPSVTRMMMMIYPRLAIPIGFLLMGLQVFNNLLIRFVKFSEYTPEQWEAERVTVVDEILKEVNEQESSREAD